MSSRALDRQVELGAFGAADPVALHRLDPLRPVQTVQGVQQLVGVGGDAEEPLLQVAPDDQVAASLAGAVGQNLLVGQDGVAPGAPVDRCVLAVGQAGFEEAQEDDLVPAHVQGVVAAELPAPVVAGPQALEAGLELLDARLGEEAGMDAGLDGRVLGRQPEAVEADRAQHRLALHRPLTDEQVAEGVVADVALVGRSARIRVHAEHVGGGAGVVVVDL